ncbi:YIP1 family protein [Tropicibacter sp. S64]|uniref:YIP1 family protein n=1 Tax=Tropicibacter sp. S64 TaxID=3415122 RepID=UPI003C7BC95B
MTPQGIVRLGIETIASPRGVARLLLSLRLPREAVVLGFVLTLVLNALLYSISLMMATDVPVAGLLASPVALMGMRAIALLILMASFTYVGRLFGGRARFSEVMLLMVWLQVLGVLAQVALTLLSPVAANLAALLAFAASALGAWITSGFLDEAHDFNNAIKAVSVLVLGVIASAVGLAILLNLVGFEPSEITGYV